MNTLRHTVRSTLKNLTPDAVIRGAMSLRTWLRRRALPETGSIFQKAIAGPVYLGRNILEELQDQYPSLPDYGYDAHSTNRRGAQRAGEILSLPNASRARSFLELGCWDGMVSCHLQKAGRQTTAVDMHSDGFDERARREGVSFLQMDAEDLQFEDGRFDCVLSYDMLEHVRHPEVVLRNAARVLSKGGLLFLSFGPLYYSPWGLHAYRTITVPYCHLLFAGNVLNEMVTSRGLKTIDFAKVNGWPLTRYRSLWDECSSSLRRIQYEEAINLSHLDLVRSYPSCFRSKTDNFDNLIVESIRVVFEKVD